MIRQTVPLLFLATLVVGNYTCSDSDCHECFDDTCNLSCQGEACRDCPDGSCCDEDNCNVCILSICCATPTCNRCIKTNRELCSEEASSSMCNSLIGNKCGLKFDELPANAVINGNHHNITTIIKLHNLINNTNVIDAAIKLNFTHINDIMLNGTVNSTFNYKRKKNCCSIVHPQECHKVSNIPNNICFTREHTECSELCYNVTNILIKAAPDVPHHCIVIAVHPYYYCGYYAVEDCSACFNCSNKTKLACLDEPSCSGTCKASVLPRKFYNVPYHIKSSNGSTGSPPVQK